MRLATEDHGWGWLWSVLQGGICPMRKKGPWLFRVYVGDEILPNYVEDYFINREIRIPAIKQPFWGFFTNSWIKVGNNDGPCHGSSTRRHWDSVLCLLYLRHSGKPTWQWKMDPDWRWISYWKWDKMGIFHCYVSLPEGISVPVPGCSVPSEGFTRLGWMSYS